MENGNAEQLRDGRGAFTRDPATVARDAEAARLRSRGLTYRQIAAELNIDVSNAHAAVKRVLAETVEEVGSEVRQLELERLDTMQQAVMDVLERQHVTVSQGRVVSLDGSPILDDGPILAAIDRLLKISESRRKLLGLDAAQKLDVTGGLTYEIVGVDPAAIG